MDLGLTGKVALVPAASSGLGRAVAIAFAREGAKVALCSRRADASEEVAATIREQGGDALAVAADVSQPADLERLVATTIDHFGGIDVLILNAGGPPAGTFDKLDDADWQAAFELTLMSAVRLIRLSLPSMRARGGGSIISMSSSSIKQPISNLLLSNSLRAAVAGLMKTLADELVGDGIRCNTVLPGSMATPRIEQLAQANAARSGRPLEEIQKERTSTIPMGRLGTPEEFADAVVFMASAPASYITGATIQVDGGAMRSLL